MAIKTYAIINKVDKYPSRCSLSHFRIDQLNLRHQLTYILQRIQKEICLRTVPFWGNGRYPSQELAMGTETFVEEGSGNLTGEERTKFQTISKLLDDEQYEQAAQLLNAINNGNNAFLVHILTAAHQICQVCKQVHEETIRHQTAYHEAEQRKRELQQQLTLILDLIQQPTTTDELGSFAIEEEQRRERNGRSWWQRLRDIFELKLSKSVPAPVEENKGVAEETAVNLITKLPEEPTDISRPILTVHCLGEFRAYINEKRVDQWQGNKCKSLFKYLVLNRHRSIPIEVLMDTFWQENDPESARRNLYQAIYLLRQTLQPVLSDFPFILSENGCYGLSPLLNIWLDSDVFEQCVENGRQLENNSLLSEAITTYEMADSLYGGDFLAEDPYEEWPITQRENFKQAHLYVLQRLSRYHYSQQNWALCAAYYQRVLAVDNCREDAHRGLMRVYYFQGQRHLALRQFHCCTEALQEELDIDPMPKTVSLHHQIQKNRLHFSPNPKLKLS
jgi:DNA-binding SARP family transcriptional activator